MKLIVFTARCEVKGHRKFYLYCLFRMHTIKCLCEVYENNMMNLWRCGDS